MLLLLLSIVGVLLLLVSKMMLLLLLSIVGVPLLPWAFRCYRRYVERGNSFLFLNRPECISNNFVECQHHKMQFHPKILKYTRIKHNGISKTRLVTMSSPYHLNVTGEDFRSMYLVFDSEPDSRRWREHVVRVRAVATRYFGIPSEEVKSVYLACTFIPSGDYLGQVWGDDFVPSDITDNLAWARNEVRLHPPNPALVRIQRQVLTNDLHETLRRRNAERRQN